MTYRAWNTKTVDRAALKELTAAIAQQNTEELEYQNMDEEWSEEKYRSVLAPSRKKPACWPASSLPGASPTPPRR